MFIAHFHEEKKYIYSNIINKHRRKIKYYFSIKYIKSELRERDSLDRLLHTYFYFSICRKMDPSLLKQKFAGR